MRLSSVGAVLALFLLMVPLAARPVSARTGGAPAPGEVIVWLRPGATPSAPEVAASLAALRVSAAEALAPNAPIYRLRLPAAIDPEVAAARLLAAPGVAYAEPNRIRRISRMPNDPAFPQQWGLRNIQAPEAWTITTGGPVVVAVLDSGVDGDHPDLAGKVLPGFNTLNGSPDARDDNGHGTAVAGLIAANTDNNAGIAGLCWECRILPVKVVDARGVGNDASLAAGIRWAADNGARVINMSLGGEGDSRLLREAIAYAAARGIVLVAASGNEREIGNPVTYPAAYPDVIAVGATGNTDTITGFSNTGDYLDLAAPGVGLWTTLPGGRYGPPNGTSFSSPYVAGAAALVLTQRPDLGRSDVGCILKASADDKGPPGKDSEYGWGRLNAFRAVQLAPAYTGCPLDAPQAEPPSPPAVAPGDAFRPVPPVNTPEVRYFPETGHTLRGAFLRFWERHGGLPIFGFPISEELIETGSDGRAYTVQYFERHRFELHPENPPPYNVLLARIGDDVLRAAGRDWYIFPRGTAQPGCLTFEATGHTLCEPFLGYWRANGLEFDGARGISFAESLALFGQPISPPQVEEIAPGVFRTVQWFERARFEDHGGQVLLGLLGNELVRARGWR
ncbi:MAG: S8 family serine peptidase [Oscillochloridaceae bacterium]|nr:S8 family serine peptidase [Chloroflexaceae bacterium]MDW8388839.1 S8 family serine peptidase [Oscillochloridaceae bacterium]